MTKPGDRAQPIPQRPRPPAGPDDDVYVVDTRRGSGASPTPRRPRSAPSDDDAYVVDTRDGSSAPARAPRRRPVPNNPATPQARPPRPRPTDAQGARRPAAAAPGGQRGAPAGARRPGGPSGPGGPGGPSGRGPAGRGPARTAGPPQRKRHRLRAVVLLLVTAIIGYTAFLVWVPIKSYNAMPKVADAPAGDRPAAGSGSNYLLVGSDSRAGLTPEQETALSTGSETQDPGQRTDSIMLLHRSNSGKSSLISIPRDSYVEIPGHGMNKINAAFAFGGPQLLVQTVEGATGLRMDGYLEIGFGGFASVVDALGGVDICVPFPMDDPRAGINLAEGCQTLDGPTALGYVRARYSDPRGDIGRAERQRQFLAAIMKKSVSPKTILDPFQYYAVVMAPSQGLAIGEDTSMWETAQIFLTMRSMSNGEGLSLVVPISTPAYQTPNAGVAVKWDTERATALFTALNNDDPLTEPPAGTDGVPSQR